MYKITATLSKINDPIWFRGKVIVIDSSGKIAFEVPTLENLFTEVIKASQFSEIKIVNNG